MKENEEYQDAITQFERASEIISSIKKSQKCIDYIKNESTEIVIKPSKAQYPMNLGEGMREDVLNSLVKGEMNKLLKLKVEFCTIFSKTGQKI